MQSREVVMRILNSWALLMRNIRSLRALWVILPLYQVNLSSPSPLNRIHRTNNLPEWQPFDIAVSQIVSYDIDVQKYCSLDTQNAIGPLRDLGPNRWQISPPTVVKSVTCYCDFRYQRCIWEWYTRMIVAENERGGETGGRRLCSRCCVLEWPDRLWLCYVVDRNDVFEYSWLVSSMLRLTYNTWRQIPTCSISTPNSLPYIQSQIISPKWNGMCDRNNSDQFLDKSICPTLFCEISSVLIPLFYSRM